MCRGAVEAQLGYIFQNAHTISKNLFPFSFASINFLAFLHFSFSCYTEFHRVFGPQTWPVIGMIESVKRKRIVLIQQVTPEHIYWLKEKTKKKNICAETDWRSFYFLCYLVERATFLAGKSGWFIQADGAFSEATGGGSVQVLRQDTVYPQVRGQISKVSECVSQQFWP